MANRRVKLECLKDLINDITRLEGELSDARAARDSLAKLLGVDWADPAVFEAEDKHICEETRTTQVDAWKSASALRSPATKGVLDASNISDKPVVKAKRALPSGPDDAKKGPPPKRLRLADTALVIDPLPHERLSLYVECAGERFQLHIKPTTRMGKLMDAMCRKLRVQPKDLSLSCDGAYLRRDDTALSWGMEDGETLEMHVHQCGGKPVIYLFAPGEVTASVELGLVPEWSISAIYPVVPVKETGRGQRLRWDVTTRTDGSLTELNTGLDVAYLFWEAHTNPRPPSPPSSPTLPHGTPFNPLTADLTPADSVLLPTATITPYLDAALRALGLHTEARTSFITYWLPSLLRHEHVALRFVPQAKYERAAPLDVRPRPDVVTRVFMLFKSVREAEVEAWAEATQRALVDVAWWRDVVGVDAEKAEDATLFRMLEWGGMEVLRFPNER